MDKSPQFKLNKTDWNKMGKDAAWFALVPLTFYFSQILGDIQKPGHILALIDFLPSNGTLISIVSYVLSQILNLIRKYIS